VPSLARRRARAARETTTTGAHVPSHVTQALKTSSAREGVDAAIGERAVSLMPHARLDVIPGNHAPFLDDPRGCAQLIHERQTDDADA